MDDFENKFDSTTLENRKSKIKARSNDDLLDMYDAYTAQAFNNFSLSKNWNQTYSLIREEILFRMKGE